MKSMRLYQRAMNGDQVNDYEQPKVPVLDSMQIPNKVR